MPLGRPSHCFLCCSGFPCSQRPLLNSHKSSLGAFKTRTVLKEKTETSTQFLLQRQADMCGTGGRTQPLRCSPLRLVQGRGLLSYVHPGMESPETRGRLSSGHGQERRGSDAVAFSSLSPGWKTWVAGTFLHSQS